MATSSRGPLNTARADGLSSGLLGDIASDDVGVTIGNGDAINTSAKQPSKTSLAAVAFVLLNTMLGSGILGLPGAFSKSGLIGGIVLLVVFGVLSIFGVHLLCEAADRAGRPASFYSVALAAAGAKAGVVIDLLVLINAFGVATSYLIVVGDVLPEVATSFHAPDLLLHRVVWMLIALGIGAPLAYLRDLSALKYTAYAAFLCVLYISAVVGIFAIAPQTFHPCTNATAANGTNVTDLYAATSLEALAAADASTQVSSQMGMSAVGLGDEPGQWGSGDEPGSSGDDAVCTPGKTCAFGEIMTLLDALPIFIFAYTCQQNALSITNEMARPTSSRVVGAATLGSVLALGLYLVVGVGGYLTYGDHVASDILKSYPEDAMLPVIARIAIAFVVTTCYPMQIHPGRNSLVSILCAFCPRGLIESVGGAEGTTLHVFATSLIVVSTIGVALCVTSLGVMLTVIGSICSTSVTFIVPGGCYVVLFREGGWRAKRLLALGHLVLGIIIAPLCLVLTFLPTQK